MSTDAVIFATTVGDTGLPTAIQLLEGESLLGRLARQLRESGAGRITVIGRRGCREILAEAVPAGDPVTVIESFGLADDLRLAADAADAAAREGHRLFVAAGSVAVHSALVDDLLRHPRVRTAALVGPRGDADTAPAYRVRVEEGQVAAAGSPYHRTGRPTGRLLDIVTVAAGDTSALAAAARRLADGVRAPSESWKAEADRKAQALAARAGDLRPGRRGSAATRIGDSAAAVALVTVGLVRTGVRVTEWPLRTFVWARPVGPDQIVAAGTALKEGDEDDARLAAAVKSDDSFFTTFFVSPYSRHLARAAARKGWSPNQVTVLSLAVGLVAAAAFALGNRFGLVAGAVLLQASFTLDCVDGQLARYTRRFSLLGAWLDTTFDRVKEYLVYAGLAVGSARAGDDVWVLATALLTVQVARHTMDFTWDPPGAPAPGPRAVPLEEAGDGVADMDATPGQEAGRGGGSPAALRWLHRNDAGYWARRVLQLSIGERFAVISLTAAFATPRLTFWVVLVWACFAAGYGLAGRVARGRR